jgi:hypothetical protein
MMFSSLIMFFSDLNNFKLSRSLHTSTFLHVVREIDFLLEMAAKLVSEDRNLEENLLVL